MKRNDAPRILRFTITGALAASLILAWDATNAFAQTAANTQPSVEARIKRARSLAAAHRLADAAAELDVVQRDTADGAVRDVARIMLMGILLEQADYTRAQSLLEDAYSGRAVNSESSTRSYFAVAGQVVNGARAHLERYRQYGLNVAERDLLPEATGDLDRLRLLLERLIAQAKEISGGNTKSTDAVALVEDAVSVRAQLARTDEERAQWQREFAGARDRIAASETRVTTFGAATIPASSRVSPTFLPEARLGVGDTPTTNASSTQSAAGTPSANTAANGARSVPPSPTPASPSDETTGRAATSGTATPTGEQPVNVGSLVDKATQRIAPTYPPAARSARVAGTVTVYLEVDEKGSVAAVQRTSGPQLLRQAAADAVKRWRFRPTLIAGAPVRVSGFVSFNFTQ